MNKCYFLFSLFLLNSCYSNRNVAEDYAVIEQLNNRMEYLYDKGQPGALADFYHEDAIIIGRDDQLEGREAIGEYWESMSYPVSMKMETLVMEASLDRIFTSEPWQELKNKMSASIKKELSSAQESGTTVFQLARMKTAYEREDVTVFNKRTTVLLDWTVSESGHFRIATTYLLD